MLRVKLIVTGDVEKLALHKSLRSMFPDRRDGRKVSWEAPRKLEGGTTTARLEADEDPSREMLVLAQKMIDEACIGKKDGPNDLVIAVVDVELGNVDREQIVVDHIRAALRVKLARYEEPLRTQYQDWLRERCSFHMLKPMVESYFFGDPAALHLAGARHPPLLVVRDPEGFESCDPKWLPQCAQENAHPDRQRLKPWWRHEKHPKHYLQHLCDRAGAVYDEGLSGMVALTALKWVDVPGEPAAAPILRCLFEDLSEWFGIENPLGPGTTSPILYPPPSTRPEQRILRNL